LITLGYLDNPVGTGASARLIVEVDVDIDAAEASLEVRFEYMNTSRSVSFQ